MTQRAQFVDLSLAKPGEKILTRDGRKGEFVRKTNEQHWPYDVWLEADQSWHRYDKDGMPAGVSGPGLMIVQVGE